MEYKKVDRGSGLSLKLEGKVLAVVVEKEKRLGRARPE